MTSRHQQSPTALERFLDGQVVSVGTVELLVLLHDGAEQPHQLDEICHALGCPSAWAELQLVALQRGGLVEGSPAAGYAYAPASPDRESAVEALVRAWRSDRVRVSRRIFASTRSSRRKGRSGGG